MLITETCNIGGRTVGHVSFKWPASPKFRQECHILALPLGVGFFEWLSLRTSSLLAEVATCMLSCENSKICSWLR